MLCFIGPNGFKPKIFLQLSSLLSSLQIPSEDWTCFTWYVLAPTKCLTHFMPLVSFNSPWKHQKRFSDVFRGYRKRPVAWNGLRTLNVRGPTTFIGLLTKSDKAPFFFLEYLFGKWSGKKSSMMELFGKNQ